MLISGDQTSGSTELHLLRKECLDNDLLLVSFSAVNMKFKPQQMFDSTSICCLIHYSSSVGFNSRQNSWLVTKKRLYAQSSES